MVNIPRFTQSHTRFHYGTADKRDDAVRQHVDGRKRALLFMFHLIVALKIHGSTLHRLGLHQV
jgi:hypothetical protein